MQGCTYLGNRAHDAAQMFDLGFTFTKSPQFGIYGNCPLITPVGYSHIDGYYVGMGGGKLGVMKHSQNDIGVLFWGNERNSWTKDTCCAKGTEKNVRAGIVGIAQGLSKGENHYKPACIHYLHVGWIGVTANFNYYAMFDFLVGWLGLDPSGDDAGEPEPIVVRADPTLPPVAGPRPVTLRH